MSRFAKNLKRKKPRKSVKRRLEKQKSNASNVMLRRKRIGRELACFSKVKLLQMQKK